MMTKLLLAINYLIVQSSPALKETEELMRQHDAAQLSRLTTILSIALITILILLTISLVKNSKLQSEIKRLKNN